MTAFARRIAIAAVLMASLALSVAARAETPKKPALLDSLGATLREGKPLLVAKDRSTLLIYGEHHDISIAGDGRVKVHDKGAVERIYALTQGLNVSLSHALGHASPIDEKTTKSVKALFAESIMHVKMRSDGIGYVGKRYTKASRPLEIRTYRFTAKVTPKGRLRIKARAKHVMGFHAPKR